MNKNVKNAPEASRRRRRTAEVARREILDAAKKRLMEGGPDNVRLKRIGEDIGLSHSSILHHFGSRSGLMEALRTDAFAALAEDLAQRIARPVEGDPSVDFFEKVSETLGEQGYGRLLAWQLMSGNLPTKGAVGEAVLGPDGSGGLLSGLAAALHKMRRARSSSLAEPEPDEVETRRIVAMMACTLLGESLAGHVMVRSAGLGSDPEDRRALRAWFAKRAEELVLLGPRLDEATASGAAAPPPGPRPGEETAPASDPAAPRDD